MAAKHAKLFFPVRTISAVLAVCPQTAQRRAQRKGWPRRQRGNRFEFCVPGRLRGKCQALSPLPRIFDQPRTLTELKRATAVLGFCLRIKRNPKLKFERALQLTVSDFKHLFQFSTFALRRWALAVERYGVMALHDNRAGHSGRKSARLEKIL
jgi:hypothetical protein